MKNNGIILGLMFVIALCTGSLVRAYPNKITVINTAPVDFIAYVNDLNTEAEPFIKMQSNEMASFTDGRYAEIRIMRAKFVGGKKAIPYSLKFPEESSGEAVVLFSGHDFVTIKRQEPSVIQYAKIPSNPASTMQH